MARTRHGHQIDGTTVEVFSGSIARCGGPGLCSPCSLDAAGAIKNQLPIENLKNDGETIDKVYEALMKAGIPFHLCRAGVSEMLNAGILFRERA